MKKLLSLLAVFLLSYFAVRPLLAPGYFPMHDDTQVSRVIEMGRALKEGQFPVRWVADLGYGYGYPIFNFYAPLPYYVGGLFYALGVPALTATKVMFGIGVILPSLLMYAVLYPVVGEWSAIAASLLYLYAPYHAVEVYVRGAVGEYWILLFWPLILYALLWSHDITRRKRAVTLGTIGLAGSVMSHTLMGYVTMLFLFLGLGIWWTVRFFRKRVDAEELQTHVRWFVLGLGLSAFFWLPAITEMQYTNVAAQVGSTANYRDHFVCLIQLWSSAWGFGGSAPGCANDGLSFMLGKLHIIAAAIGFLGYILIGKKSISRVYVVVALVVSVLGIVFTLPISGPLWHMLPMFSYLQYPWRFLSLAAFGLSLLGALVVACVDDARGKIAVAVVIVVGVMVVNAKWFMPQYQYIKDSRSFETADDIEWRASKISDEYLPENISRPMNASEVVSATIRSDHQVTVTSVVSTAVEKQLIVESTTAATLTINTASFPGWIYRVNDKEVHPAVIHGLPQLDVGPGQSVIVIKFTDTPIRTIGNLASVATLVFIILTYGKKRKTNR